MSSSFKVPVGISFTPTDIPSSVKILSINHLGDFLIDLSASQMIVSSSVVSISTNDVLNRVLELDSNIYLLPVDDNSNPASFLNFKYLFSRFRWVEIISSLYKYYSIIKNNFPKGTVFIVNRFDFRYILVTLSHKRIYLPNRQNNIYVRYNTLSASFDFSSQYIKFPNCNVLSVFPDSRLSSKSISPLFLKKIIRFCIAQNFIVNIYTMFPDDFSICLSDSSVISIDSLSALNKSILSSSLVIAADSLPAHLAYFHRKPHFVFYNRLNYEYMTPFISTNSFYSLFDVDNMDNLCTFLSNCNA